MIGTQMIAKGLDFPNVTLVGVLSADQSLYANDFRSTERTFSLITQVVGRSGRGDKIGRALIQTYNPENHIIQFAANQNYKAFYQDEIESRKALLYPPFCDICVVGFSGLDEVKTRYAALMFLDILKKQAKQENGNIPLKVLGPTQAGIYKMNNKYRYRIIIKCRANKDFKHFLKNVIVLSGKEKSLSNITIFADINGDINI
jgi:primosomal protein N' (replication factor Y)